MGSYKQALSDQDKEIILHCRRSVLFNNSQVWQKTDNPSFDVSMGSYDGAEVCEIVGLYILHRLRSKFNNKNIGLYRDDGLAAFSNMGPRTANKIRKNLIDAFKDFDLRITCQTNLKIVNYLDVTLDLKTEKFSPYRKPDNTPSFIHARSNHPPAILKQIPRSVGHRISSLSSNEEEFQKAAPLYNEA